MKGLTVGLLALCTAPIVAVPIATYVAASPATMKPVAVKEPQAIDIIHKQGQFIFTDGSSSYIFKKDGTFKSFPLGTSGRMIEGTWKTNAYYGFVIRGVWSQINGLSSPDDQRKMTLRVLPRKTFKTVKTLRWALEKKPVKVYDCYFEIEGLVKVPKKATSSTNQ